MERKSGLSSTAKRKWLEKKLTKSKRGRRRKREYQKSQTHEERKLPEKKLMKSEKERGRWREKDKEKERKCRE